MSLLVNRQIQKSQRGNQLVLFYWSWGQIFILVCTFSGPHSVSFSIPFLRERALIRQIESESIRVKWIPNPPCVWCHAWTGADQCLKIFRQMVCSTFRLQCLLEILWWFCHVDIWYVKSTHLKSLWFFHTLNLKKYKAFLENNPFTVGIQD